MTLPNVEKIAVRRVQLADPWRDLDGLSGYSWCYVLVQFKHRPLGALTVPVTEGRVPAAVVERSVAERMSSALARAVVDEALSSKAPHPPCATNGAATSSSLVTVAVCTRDRAEDVERCIQSLLALDYPALDVLIVDNASKTDATRQVAARYPTVRYVHEPRPGLDWARNRAWQEARGDIVAYTDDDVVVDSRWVRALVDAFREHPEVMAVTGLVSPLELETRAQIEFEVQGGFGRGFDAKWFGVDLPGGQSAAEVHGGTGKFGTGANMAFRRSVFELVGAFDPALDVGTVTNGGGDLEMYFRVLKAGYILRYAPDAIVFHRHRRDEASLRKQIRNNGVGFLSYVIRECSRFPEERAAFGQLLTWWLFNWIGPRLARSRLSGNTLQRDLATQEFLGSFDGVARYARARKQAAALAGSANVDALDEIRQPRRYPEILAHAVAVRSVEIGSLEGLADVAAFARTRVFVRSGSRVLGSVDIDNYYSPIPQTQLTNAIVSRFSEELWGAEQLQTRQMAPKHLQRLLPAASDTKDVAERPPVSFSASIVIATRDRPNDLRRCLESLTRLEYSGQVEVVVVDNNPDSGLTGNVVGAFPHVRLVTERRGGLSYARNTGILASNSEIIVCTDDDVAVDAAWLSRLLAPFRRPEVHCVTGNVLPLELDTPAQLAFEAYGGLSRGFASVEFDRTWFDSHSSAVPTWHLGATANAAFRASVFSDPCIGLFEESLGAGTPTGVGEDTYLFYRLLKAGHVLVYEPSAVVWHRHRKTMAELHKQIFAYSKGHVAYHLHTLLRDADRRIWKRVLLELPSWHLRQLLRGARDELLQRPHYPLHLTWLELRGNLLGPLSLVQSYARVRRLGRSSSRA